MAKIELSIQPADFDPGKLQAALPGEQAVEGAIATFTGYVRGDSAAGTISCMELEHYPQMTEKCIRDIMDRAVKRWDLMAASVVHRIGPLAPGDRIVWVGVSAAHRGAAFAACEYIMDYLKTRAPFWKKEHGPDGASWVDARESDGEAARRWENTDAV